MLTLPDDLRTQPAEMHRRMALLLDLVSRVESLPDTGTHGPRCTHRDCMAQRARAILMRGDEA